MPWLPYALAVAGLILGPAGIIWTLLNWRTDDTGKRIAQTAEIVVMLQQLIRELEKALERTEHELAESKAETAAAELAVQQAEAKCRALQRELDGVRSQLARLQGDMT